MTSPAILLVWLALLLLLGVEIFVAYIPSLRFLAPVIGGAMATMVATTYMRLAFSRGLPLVFALAGSFWLAVLFGMGSLDSFTRHDVAVHGQGAP